MYTMKVEYKKQKKQKIREVCTTDRCESVVGKICTKDVF